jgi:ribonuclease P protein component
MLSTDNRLRDRKDFGAVREQGRRWRGDVLIVNAMPRAGDLPVRFGFVISRKIGTAVVRNRIKRRLRAVMHAHLAEVVRGYDVVIISRQPASSATYAALETAALDLLRRAGLMASMPERTG